MKNRFHREENLSLIQLNHHAYVTGQKLIPFRAEKYTRIGEFTNVTVVFTNWTAKGQTDELTTISKPTTQYNINKFIYKMMIIYIWNEWYEKTKQVRNVKDDVLLQFVPSLSCAKITTWFHSIKCESLTLSNPWWWTVLVYSYSSWALGCRRQNCCRPTKKVVMFVWHRKLKTYDKYGVIISTIRILQNLCRYPAKQRASYIWVNNMVSIVHHTTVSYFKHEYKINNAHS